MGRRAATEAAKVGANCAAAVGVADHTGKLFSTKIAEFPMAAHARVRSRQDAAFRARHALPVLDRTQANQKQRHRKKPKPRTRRQDCLRARGCARRRIFLRPSVSRVILLAMMLRRARGCWCRFGARRPTTRQRLVRRKRHIGHRNVAPKSGIPQCPGASFESAPALPNNAS